MMMQYDTACLTNIKDLLTERGATISVAESVTSGLLQAAFSSVNEATRFFQGGITAYNNGQKARHLMVEPIHAEACNCVSERVSSEMAVGCNRLFSSDYSLGITGYANRPPELDIPVLYAYLAIARGRDVLMTRKLTSKETEMTAVQLDYTNQALAWLVKVLKAA